MILKLQDLSLTALAYILRIKYTPVEFCKGFAQVRKTDLSDEILQGEEADKADGIIVVNTVNTDKSNHIEKLIFTYKLTLGSW